MLYAPAKRILDIVFAVGLGIVFLPVALVTGIAIKLDSPGPVFADTPKRIGKDGKPFYLYKFRSMMTNAYYLLRTDPKFRKAYREQQSGGNYKIKDDPRVTRVGRFIRKYSIDEVPQLINVLKGEMSLVGPRPCFPEELEKQKRRYPSKHGLIKDILSVKPGITGYWQVSGRSNVNFDKRIGMDAYFARKKSLFLDIVILFKTPWAMISGKGAV